MSRNLDPERPAGVRWPNGDPTVGAESEVAMRISCWIGALVVSAAVLSCKGGAADSAGEADAVTAAEGWLALVDGEKYAESWDQSAAYFKGVVASDAWQKQIAGVRKPLGKLVSRKVKSKQAVTSVPGAPDGHYVVIQFDASFDSKSAAVETVTPMQDPDGKWRVAGYFIK